jgi:hypothetical protein
MCELHLTQGLNPEGVYWWYWPFRATFVRPGLSGIHTGLGLLGHFLISLEKRETRDFVPLLSTEQALFCLWKERFWPGYLLCA